MAKTPPASLIREVLYLFRLLSRTVLFVCAPVILIVTLFHYPYDTDATPLRSASAAGFYEAAYRPASFGRGLDYEKTAKAAAERFGIAGIVRNFVDKYDLARAKVLEVGSGRGYLQDIVEDYTGLDLSPSVARHYHKPLVVGSATEMPFPANSFDALWTVWVMEHIPEPEKAFREMRRVVRPDGLLLLYVAWNCAPWAAQGFEVRPYSDFTWPGKLVKATLPIRTSLPFVLSYLIPTRALRWAFYELNGTRERLHFRRLEPNYEVYWQPDSDAAIALDSFETYLWFRARGDECLNCGSTRDEMWKAPNPLIIRVRK